MDAFYQYCVTGDDDQNGPDRRKAQLTCQCLTGIDSDFRKCPHWQGRKLLPDRLGLRAASVGAVRVIPTRVGELVLVMRLPDAPGVARCKFFRWWRCGTLLFKNKGSPVASKFLLFKKDCELEHECSAKSSRCLPVAIHIAPA
jgi:hypothetical protein